MDGCEVWGMSDIRGVEIFHRSFLRIMLKTFKFTPNCMLYGETGTTDLYTVVKNRMINFWAKLKFGDQNKLSSIMLRLLDKLQLEQPEKFSFKWITQIKGILENTGFSEVWTADSIDSDLFKIVFKQRCDDIFKQTWLTDMMNNSQCTEYRKMKELREFENYLIELEPSDRIALSKFRTPPIIDKHGLERKIIFNTADKIQAGSSLTTSLSTDYILKTRNTRSASMWYR